MRCCRCKKIKWILSTALIIIYVSNFYAYLYGACEIYRIYNCLIKEIVSRSHTWWVCQFISVVKGVRVWRFTWFLYILYRFVYTSSKSIFQSYLTLDKKVSTTTGSKTEQKERLLPSVHFVDAHSFWFNHERYTTNFLSI